MEGFYSFLSENDIYIVLFIVLTIWIGIFIFLNSTDKRLKEIEKELKENQKDEK